MVDNELLLALSDVIDKKLEPINSRLDGLELQIKSTKRILKNELHKSESLILGEAVQSLLI